MNKQTDIHIGINNLNGKKHGLSMSFLVDVVASNPDLKDSKISAELELIEDYLKIISIEKGMNMARNMAMNTPFKLEYIQSALTLGFGKFAAQRKSRLLFELAPDNMIISANRITIIHCCFYSLFLLLEKSTDLTLTVRITAKDHVLNVDICGKLPSSKLSRTRKELKKEGIITHLSTDTLKLRFDFKEIFHQNTNSEINISKRYFPYLFSITGEGPQLVREILYLILECVPAENEAFAQALHDKDWNVMARLAHKLKPTYQNIERPDIADQLQQIEESALAKNHSMLKIQFSDYKGESDRAMEILIEALVV
ncbi:MAG: hypothetical protein ABJ004_05090 [Cyclobacteriaceae bacterium]